MCFTVKLHYNAIVRVQERHRETEIISCGEAPN